MLALDQWKSLEYPPALLVRFATDLELRGIKIKQDEQKPAAPASAKGSLAPTAGQVKAKAPASLTTGGDSKKPAPASPAKAAGAAALKRAALMASTDGSVPASLFDDLDLPASPARVTVPAAAEPPAAQKPVAASAGAAEKPSPKDDKKDNKGKENNKPAAAVPEPPAEVPIVWQVTFAKARYFERASNVVPKHDVPPPSPQNGTSSCID